jgi:tetratricopeptide (TPR) repeat protein
MEVIMKRLLIVVCLITIIVVSFTGCETSFMTAGKVYLQQSNYAKAMEQFRLEIENEPNKADGYLWVGKTFAYIQKYDSSVVYFDKAMVVDKQVTEKDIKTDKGNWWLYYHNAGVQLVEDKNIDMAIKRFKFAIEITPESISSYNILGYSYSLKKDYPNMINIYEKAIEIDSKNLQAYINLGQYYTNQEKYKKAIEYFEIAKKIDPDMPKAYYYEGVAYSGLNQYDEAIVNYKKAIEIYKKNDDNKAIKDVLFNIGIVLMRNKNYKEAIPYLLELLEIDDQDKDALMNVGTCYINTKEYKKSLQIFNKLIEIDPNNADAYTNRGIAKQKMGDKKGAMKDIKKGMSLQ